MQGRSPAAGPVLASGWEAVRGLGFVSAGWTGAEAEPLGGGKQRLKGRLSGALGAGAGLVLVMSSLACHLPCLHPCCLHPLEKTKGRNSHKK